MTSADKQVLRERYAEYITAWEERERREEAELLARAALAEKSAPMTLKPNTIDSLSLPL